MFSSLLQKAAIKKTYESLSLSLSLYSLFTFFTSFFNPRECAILTLAFAGLILALFFKAGRSVLRQGASLIYGLFTMKMYLVMVFYLSTCVFVFYRLGIWEPEMLKDTIKWYLFAATVTFFRYGKFQEGRKAYLEVFGEIFKGSVLMEFFTGKFTFSYPVELVGLPVLTFFVFARTITEKDDRYKSADQLFRKLIIAIGLICFSYVIFHGVADFRTWFNIESLQELLLAPVLSILLLPFMFVVSVYLSYEVQYVLLANKLRSPGLLPYAKRKAFLSFLWDIHNLDRWVRRMKFEKLHTKEELDDSVRALRKTRKIEQNPPQIPQEEGWSPYKAIRFLEPDFKTGYYDPRYEDNWMADSKHVYIGDSSRSNYMRYEVLGSSRAARSLELALTVITPDADDQIRDIFAAYVIDLFLEANCNSFPADHLEMIQDGVPFAFQQGGSRMKLTRNVWQNTKKSYELVFTIKKGEATDDE